MECWEIRKTQPLRVGCIGSGQNPQPKVKFKPPDFRGFFDLQYIYDYEIN